MFLLNTRSETETRSGNSYELKTVKALANFGEALVVELSGAALAQRPSRTQGYASVLFLKTMT